MAEQDDIRLIDYIDVIRQRLKFILLGTVIVMLGAIAYFWGYAQPVYEAKASLLNIEPRFQKFSTEVTSNALTMVSLKNLIESRDLIAEVRKQMGWEQKIKLDDLIESMDAKLLVEEDTNIRKTYAPIIELYAKANSGKDAADLANTWAKLFIQHYNDLTKKVSSQTYTFIQNEYQANENILKKKQAELESANQRLLDSKKKLASSRSLLSGYLSPSNSDDSNFSSSAMVEKLSENDRKDYQPNTKTSMNVEAPASTGLLESNHLIGYEGQLHDTELKIKELEAREKSGQSVKAELAGTLARKKELQNKITQLNQEMTKLENIVASQGALVDSLQRDVATSQSKFIFLAKRKGEADIEKARLENTTQNGAIESDDIKVASWAVPSEKKVGPKRTIGTLAAGIVGFLIFTLIAFLQDYISTSRKKVVSSP